MRVVKNNWTFRKWRRPKRDEMQTFIAYAASMMLTGVPPQVCETAIQDFYSSVKRSLGTILH